MRRSIAGLGLAAALTLGGCDTGPAGPARPLEPGSLSFRYSGGLPGWLEGGSFAASGAPELDARGRAAAGEWALAGPHPLSAELLPVGSKVALVAAAPGGERGGALVVLTLPRVPGPAAVAIDGGCAEVGCARGLILLGVDPRSPHDAVRGSCELSSGTVQIAATEGGRLRGTFSAKGRCVVDPRSDPFFELTIEQGEFDLEIVEAYRSGLGLWS